jgi:four helix bundle protein
MKRQHRQLAVWREAMDLVVEIYRLSSLLPKEEVFGLSAQMRRAAV